MTFRAFLAAAVSATLLPIPVFAYQGVFQPDSGVSDGPAGIQVRLKRVHTQRDRINFNKAMQIYREYVRQGKTGFVRPNVNDPATIKIYLDNPAAEDRTEDDVKTPLTIGDYVSPPVDSISEQELSSAERAALTRYRRIGKCFRDDRFSEGFLDLCLRLIQGQQKKRTTGLSPDTLPARIKNRPKTGSSSSGK